MRIHHSTPAAVRSLSEGPRQAGPAQNASVDPLAHQRSGFVGLDATGRMAHAIQAERAQLNQRKMSFSPEEQKKLATWETERRAHNGKLQQEIGKVSDEIARVHADPKLSPEQKQKKLAGLQKKKGELRARMKPPVDAQRVTAEVDRVMNDPSIQDKKKALQEIRERAGLSGDQMHEMFTGRLGRLNAESMKRVEGQRNELKAALGEQLKQAEKTHGKDSPQAKAIRGQFDGVEKTAKKELDRLNSKAGQLSGAFKRGRRRIGSRIKAAFKKMGRKIKSGFKKVGRALKKGFQAIGKGFKKIGKYLLMGLDLVVAGLSFIPGVGQIIGMAYNGVRMIVDFARKDWKGGLKRLAGMIPGVGGALSIAGAIGGKVADVVTKVADFAKKGVGIVKGAVGAVKAGINKDWGALAGSLVGIGASAASVAGTGAGDKAADILGHIQKGTGVASAAARKDIGGALGAAAGLAGGVAGEFDTANAQRAQEIIGHVGRGSGVVDGLVRQDFDGALAAAAGVAGGVGTARGDRAAAILGHMATGTGIVEQAARERDFGGAALNIGGFAGELGAPVQVQRAFAGAGHALNGDLDELVELIQSARLGNLRG